MLATKISEAVRDAVSVLRPRPKLTLSEWAERHFYLSAESSYVESRWRAYPYQTAILDVMGDDRVEEVVFCKSARVGYTKMALAAVAYFAEHKGRNQALWQPTDDDCIEFVKTELDPMLRDVDVMRRIFPEVQSRNKNNTLQQKVFLGSTLHIRGGKAAKNYRRLTVGVAVLDELDGFDSDVESEGSPVTLARKRLEGATFPKLILGSTPKLRGFSLIEARDLGADRRMRYHVPCPSCGEEHPLEWGGKDKSHGMQWVNDDPETVGHVCRSCGAIADQADYLRVWQRGRWRDESGHWIDSGGVWRDPGGSEAHPPRSVSFRIWTAYSPQTTWAQIVREFLSAQRKAKAGDTSELKTFVNTTLGETWQEETEAADDNALMRRAEPYALRTVPAGVGVLTAGIDVQDDRFEVVVWGWGAGCESWVIDYAVLPARPGDERAWQVLSDYVESTFDGIPIKAAAIDTGGHFTHQAYQWARQRPHLVYAIKGDSQPGKPIKGRASKQDVNWRGEVIKRGVRLHLVGTDTAKDLIFGRLAIKQSGPGCMHFSDELPAEFYRQLTGESRVVRRTPRGDVFRWIKQPGRRVEVLDCTVYATFAAHALGLDKFTDRMWSRLIKPGQKQEVRRLDPEQEPEKEPEAPVPAPVLRRQQDSMMSRLMLARRGR